MILDMLMIFVIAVIILFILSVFTMEETPFLSIAFIMLGMIFSVLCAYEFWNFEWFYIGYNSTTGNSTPYIYNTFDYGTPYSYVFMMIFFIYCILFIKAGFNTWKQSLETKGEMDFKKRKRR